MNLVCRLLLEKKTTCIKVFSKEFTNETIQNFKPKQALIIEDLDENFHENLLYTVLNIIEQENKYLLITSLKPLSKFNFILPDRSEAGIYMGPLMS